MKYIGTHPKKWDTLKPLARENRHEQTFAEKVIWNLVRNNGLGVKFRRQHAIADFIVDFVCFDKMLIIEIDGESHIGKEDYDKYRENILIDLGYKVLRFHNEEVIGNGNIVESKISEYLKT